LRELALYLVAAALYIALGVAYPNLLLSWFEGTAFLLLAVWIVPAFVRRLLR
jgi:membrane protein implicated in regulation of membrane protease activity